LMLSCTPFFTDQGPGDNYISGALRTTVASFTAGLAVILGVTFFSSV
jgi:hypothetical protein